MKVKERSSRVDRFGRAYAGSQRQIQTWVNMRPKELEYNILKELSKQSSSSPPANSKILWVSPLAQDKFAEYQDEEFLTALGLGKLCSELHGFWPKGGPSWDALGVINSPSDHGYILIEAKSHQGELASECGAKDPASVRQIHDSLAKAQRWVGFGAVDPVQWTKPFYQYANRVAHLYFLRKNGIKAWLVNVYFLNDPHWPLAPRSPSQWNETIIQVERSLGFRGEDIGFMAKVFLDASEGH